MFADPFKKRLPKNLQFFTARDRRLAIEPFKLLRGESIHDRGIDFISLFFPKGMCLVAVGHLVKILSPSMLFGGGPPELDPHFYHQRSFKTPRPSRSCGTESKRVAPSYLSCFLYITINR